MKSVAILIAVLLQGSISFAQDDPISIRSVQASLAPSTVSQASQTCASFNNGVGKLVSIHSPTQREKVKDAIGGGGGAQLTYWVGASLKHQQSCLPEQRFRKDCWVWQNGQLADIADGIDWDDGALTKTQTPTSHVVLRSKDAIGNWLVLDIEENSKLHPFLCDTSP